MTDQWPFEAEEVEVETTAYVPGPGRPMVPARRRTDRTTKVLVAVLIWAIGFLAGARLQSVLGGLGEKADDASEPTVEPSSPGGGGPDLSTAGTVKAIDGNALYLVDGSGRVVKVLISPESAITASTPARLGDLRPGDDVVVRGRPQPDGTVAATSVSEAG